MSVFVGSVSAEGEVPPELIILRSIDPYVYASRNQVELFTKPVNLSPDEARRLAAILVEAAKTAESLGGSR